MVYFFMALIKHKIHMKYEKCIAGPGEDQGLDGSIISGPIIDSVVDSISFMFGKWDLLWGLLD